MIKHLVFDFGGVLLDLDGVHTGYPDNLAEIFGITFAEAVALWNEHKTSVITGRETPLQFLARMKQERSFTFDVDAGLAYWEAQNTIDRSRIDWQLLELIKQLRTEYQLHMLTDQIQLQNGATAWIDQVENHFDHIFRSYEQGYRKPFAEAYQNMLAKIEATDEPESVVFIDDNLGNIEAAKALGIHSILYTFKDHAHLQSSLQKLGVQLPPAVHV